MLDDNDRLRAHGPGALNPWDGLFCVNPHELLKQAEALERLAAKFPPSAAIDPEHLRGSPGRSSRHPERHLVAVTAKDLLARVLPPRECLLGPWLRAKDLGMIYAPTGRCKTWFSLGIACAVGAGGRFLIWVAPMARQVLYVDGELPIELLQERIRIIMRSCNLDTQGHLKLITPDLQEFGTPNIATVEGQAMIEEHLGGVDLLVLDNLSCLCRGGVENEAESWEPVQEWLLRLRSRGITVLFDHHAGRSGNPRGTSKREDVIDLIVGLKAPDNYTPEEGARFEIHFEKARGLHGKAIEAIEASLQADANGNPVWTTRTIEDAVLRRVIDLAADGLSQADIATEIGRHKSTVSRALKNVREKLDDEAAKVRVKVRNLLNGAGKEGLAPEQIAAQLRIEEQEVRFHLVGCAKRRSDGRWIAS